jgi:hypothetical protein
MNPPFQQPAANHDDAEGLHLTAQTFGPVACGGGLGPGWAFRVGCGLSLSARRHAAELIAPVAAKRWCAADSPCRDRIGPGRSGGIHFGAVPHPTQFERCGQTSLSGIWGLAASAKLQARCGAEQPVVPLPRHGATGFWAVRRLARIEQHLRRAGRSGCAAKGLVAPVCVDGPKAAPRCGSHTK